MQGARCSETGFTLPAAQRGSVPGAAQAGGARRPPEGGLRSVQVSHTTVETVNDLTVPSSPPYNNMDITALLQYCFVLLTYKDPNALMLN